MITRILFPYRIGDDNRNAFAFTIEMARRSNTDIIALPSPELSQYHMQDKAKLEIAIRNKGVKRNQIKLVGKATSRGRLFKYPF